MRMKLTRRLASVFLMFIVVALVSTASVPSISALKEATIVRCWAKYRVLSASLGEPQTLYANVTNIGTEHVWVKVCFEIFDESGVLVKSFETGVKKIPSNPRHDFKILKVEWMPPLELGHFEVLAFCYYDADCDHIPEVMDGIGSDWFTII